MNTFGSDVFNETLSPTQCTNASSLYSLNSFYCPGGSSTFGYSLLYSSTKMTIELGLQICDSFGFKYAAFAT